MSQLPTRILGVLPSLSPSARRVAQRVLDDQAGAAASTITELAAAADCSPSSVVRFCRALGLSGYPELRLALAAEAGRVAAVAKPEYGNDIGAGDELDEMVAKIAFADAAAVEQTAGQLDIAALGRVVAAVDTAGQVLTHGMGASALVAADLQTKLSRIGRFTACTADSHVALSHAALLGRGDVAIGISYSGETTETVAVLTEARAAGAWTAAVTNFPRSTLAEAADAVLTTATRETTFRSGAMASRIAQLTVIDCVFVGVARRWESGALRALRTTRDAVLRAQGRT